MIHLKRIPRSAPDQLRLNPPWMLVSLKFHVDSYSCIRLFQIRFGRRKRLVFQHMCSGLTLIKLIHRAKTSVFLIRTGAVHHATWIPPWNSIKKAPND